MRTATFSIDGETYSVTLWSAEKGLDLLFRLGEVLGEPLARLTETRSIENENVEAAIAAAVGSLFKNVKSRDAVGLIKECLETTCVGPACVAQDFNSRFAGRFGVLFKVLAKTLHFQYGDFFAAVGALRKPGAAPTV